MTTIPNVQWTGTISEGRNAINAAGNGDGGRITFDIPATERHVIAELMAMTQKNLIITIIAEDDALPFDEGQPGYDGID